jgi:DNA invertase Pin-like site-specific DNA recombinase
MPTRQPLQPAAPQIHVAEYVRMSTDHQRYSIANQSALLHAYAAANEMRIVQSYADPGRSGLTLRQRPGLSQLLEDILAGRASFEAVLVYDVSRWGRFQDADESAHYEFLCRRAGIRVIYCAEQFAADGTPFGSVLKALKRAMAGEYSRELSVKVAAGKARIGQLGFRVGGIAGYGLRRQVLEDGKTPGLVLRDDQRKSIQTDRVRLIPGPHEEIRIVRRIYRDYIYCRKSERQIASDLNAEGLTCFGRCWSRNIVRTVLGNEKYIGNHIVGQFSQRLRTKQIVNPPEKWIRCDGVFQAIVPRELFDAAARVRSFNERTYISHDEILRAMKVVLRREGRLTATIINAAPELPSANTVEMRFGTLCQAYQKMGYLPPPRYRFYDVDRSLRTIHCEARAGLVAALRLLGVACTETGNLIAIERGCTVEVLVCRFQRPRSYQSGWRASYQRNLGASVLLACRMRPDNGGVLDYLLLSRGVVDRLPLLIQPRDDLLIAPFRHESVQSAARVLVASRDEGAFPNGGQTAI